MGGMKIRRLPVPEAGAEREVYLMVNHRCPQSKQAEENGDLVLFAVGYYGMEIPAGIPFEVTSTEECGACGKYLKAMFEWSAPRIWTP